MNAAERFFYEGEPTFSPTTGAGLSKDVWARIDGLEKRPDLNGSRVRCVKYSASKERWIVNAASATVMTTSSRSPSSVVSLVRVVSTVSWLSPEPVAEGNRAMAVVDGASPADGTEQLEVSLRNSLP